MNVCRGICSLFIVTNVLFLNTQVASAQQEKELSGTFQRNGAINSDSGPTTAPANSVEVKPEIAPPAQASNPTEPSRAAMPPNPYVPPPPSYVAQSVHDGSSVAPILGYDPTYGVLLGGGYFFGDTDEPVTTGNIVFTGTFHGNYAAIAKYKLWTREDWYIAFELGATHFFDSYFGEGDNTSPKNQIKIQNYRTYSIPAVGYRFSDYNSLILSSELRYRHETGVNGDSNLRYFGDDFTPIFNIAYMFDNRDDRDDTKKGTYLQTKFYFGPKGMSTRKDAETFLKMLVELRQFFSLASFITVGFQAQAGTSWGEPGYQYRFDLGGSTDMRGYQSNRLRGRHFYEEQNELRVAALKWLTLVGFYSVGDTADVKLNQFYGAKVTKGGGVRLGLPPDYVAKARFDFGIAPDEKNFYLSFNEAF